MPYSAKIGSDTLQIEFWVFHNALLRLPQNSYSARWVSDQVFLGRVFMTPYASMGIPVCIPWQVFLWVFLCLVFKYARWEMMPRFLRWDSDAALF